MSQPPKDKQPPRPRRYDRRQFFYTAGRAGLLLAGAAGLGLGLGDAKGPGPGSGAKLVEKLWDFSVAGQKPAMALVRGTGREACLRAGLKALGGLGRYIKKGDRVLIKVNAAFASPPSVGATTNPGLLAETVRQLKAAGASEVLVADNPIQDPAACFNFSGLAQACASSGARLILPAPDRFMPYSLPGGRLLVNWPLFMEPLLRADKVIGLAPVKDHHRSGASLSMKNWYGLLGGERAVFHQQIHQAISEMARMVRPTLVILDGITSMVANGPTGGSLSDLRHTRELIISSDQVAADARAASLLGKTPDQLPFIALAQAAGVGTSDYASLSPRLVEAQ